jgi:hypothetical protein
MTTKSTYIEDNNIICKYQYFEDGTYTYKKFDPDTKTYEYRYRNGKIAIFRNGKKIYDNEHHLTMYKCKSSNGYYQRRFKNIANRCLHIIFFAKIFLKLIILYPLQISICQ